MAPGCEICLALGQVETAGLIVEHPGTRDGSRARIRSRWEQRSASRSFDSKVSPPSPFRHKQDDNIIDDRTDWPGCTGLNFFVILLSPSLLSDDPRSQLQRHARRASQDRRAIGH